MDLRKILGIIAGAIGILLVCCLPASAKDLCFTLGTNAYFTSASIPSKGLCETFSLAAKAPYFPGYLATGSMCLSSNGTTVLLNLSDGYFNGTESIQGTFNKNTGAGTVSDCIWPAPLTPNRIEVESVDRKETDNERQPIQRGADHRGAART